MYRRFRSSSPSLPPPSSISLLPAQSSQIMAFVRTKSPTCPPPANELQFGWQQPHPTAVEADPADDDHGVSSQLFLKPDSGRRSLDKEVALQIIRRRKRANQIRTALETLVGTLPSASTAGAVWPEDDVFSSP